MNSTARGVTKSIVSMLVMVCGIFVLIYGGVLAQGTLQAFFPIVTVLWSIVTMDLHSFIAQNNHGLSVRTIFQSEALGAVISFMILSLIWINNAERLRFFLLVLDYDVAIYWTFAIVITTAGLCHFLFKRLSVTWSRKQNKIQPSTTFIFISIATAIIYSIGHRNDVPWAYMAAIGLLATGAYLSSRSVRSNVRPSVAQAQRYEERSLSWVKVVALIGITFWVLSTYSSGTITAAIRNELGRRTDEEFLTIDPDLDDNNFMASNIKDIIYDTSPEEIKRQELRIQCFVKTRKQIMDTIYPLIPRDKNFMAVDFPLGWDLGYQQIWMGQERLWHIYGQFPLRMTELNQRDISSVQSVRLIFNNY